METIGIKKLEARLSEYVNRSREGERIVITDCGREVAELTPLSASRKAMMALREQGKVVWSGGKPCGLHGRSAHGEPVAQTVLDDRR